MSQRKALERIDGGMGKKPALIIVDVVVGFTDPSCPLGSEADAVVAANIELMNVFHQANLPVVLTTVTRFPLRSAVGETSRQRLPRHRSG